MRIDASRWQSGIPAGTGVLVVGHGTADPVGVAETRQVTDLVARMLPGVSVTLGFLEVCGPSIDEAVGVLAAAGCHQIIAAPLLLFEAGHAKRDVPDALRLAALARGLDIHQAEPLGSHPDIVAMSRRRRAQALGRSSCVPPDETTIVFVGRGSSDPSADDQLAGFAAESLQGESGYHRVLFGFVAAARPSLTEALEAAADPSDRGVRTVVVQPHLLFRGHVEDQVAAAIDVVRANRPGLRFERVARLGPDPLVARALAARAVARASELALKSSRQT